MHLDLEETPIFNKIEINGRLTFKQGMDITLNAKKILIRGGELRIGTKEERYTNKGTIFLWGRKDEPTIAIEDQGVEAGSKIIANIGILTMYGKQRSFKMARLAAEAKKGDTSITLDKRTATIDLVAGDQIALLATDFLYDKGENVTVKAYDQGSGVVTLESALVNYHWGAAESTGNEYEGLDMRGEVVSLSRNIKIIGENVDSFGCQILTSDIMEIDGTERNGVTTLDSVEVEYGG